MSKPIYEIPVSGDGQDGGVAFPPPPPHATPVSYSPAPPEMASAPAPTGWPLYPVPSDEEAATLSHQTYAAPPPHAEQVFDSTSASPTFPAAPPTGAPVFHGAQPSATPNFGSPLPPDFGSATPPPAAPAYEAPQFDPPQFEEPKFAEPAQYEAPTQFDAPTYEEVPPQFEAPKYEEPQFDPLQYKLPSTPQPDWDAPQAASDAYEIPVVSIDEPLGDDLLNFPPPRATVPSRHSDDFIGSGSVLPARVVDFGEEAGYADADPDLTAALRDVLLLNASDLHVTANMPPMVRVDGALINGSFTEAWDADKVRTALRSIMTEPQKEIFDRDLELDFAYTVSANARFRVNFYQQREAMGAAFRLIPTEIKQLADLGIPDSIARFATLARGLVLVTGPTGSGKSTTLAALVDLVNRTRADHIMTVEDPIEFLHGNHKSLVNQREVGNDTHSFGAALKHVLRQDPDVILIGELRDLETISVALTAAETGHLVFATLHTQDAAQTIDRIIDVFPPHQQGQVRSQLAATLQGVVCQTLVKKASGKGRVVATEVLIATPAVANLIREGKTFQIASAMQAGGDLGMHTMDRHLADLANSGIITQRAAMDKAQDVEGLKQLIHRVETPSDAASRAMDESSINFNDAYSGAGN
jgi:twitching motility protein PilT